MVEFLVQTSLILLSHLLFDDLVKFQIKVVKVVNLKQLSKVVSN